MSILIALIATSDICLLNSHSSYCVQKIQVEKKSEAAYQVDISGELESIERKFDPDKAQDESFHAALKVILDKIQFIDTDALKKKRLYIMKPWILESRHEDDKVKSNFAKFLLARGAADKKHIDLCVLIAQCDIYYYRSLQQVMTANPEIKTYVTEQHKEFMVKITAFNNNMQALWTQSEVDAKLIKSCMENGGSINEEFKKHFTDRLSKFDEPPTPDDMMILYGLQGLRNFYAKNNKNKGEFVDFIKAIKAKYPEKKLLYIQLDIIINEQCKPLDPSYFIVATDK